MQTQEKILDALHNAMPGATQTEIAAAVGVSLARWNNYERGKRHMDDDAVIGACAALRYTPKQTRETLAAHRAETAHTARELAFWRQLGAAATLAAVALLAAPGEAYAASNAYYVKWRARLFPSRSARDRTAPTPLAA